MSVAYQLARLGSTLAGWTPRSVRHAVGSAVSGATYFVWRSKRLVTLQNMAQVTGLPVDHPRVRHLAYASWRNYGRYAADFMYFPHLDTKREVMTRLQDMTKEGKTWQEQLAEIRQKEHGVIFATSHFGNWDVAAAIVALELPLTAIAETFTDPRMDTLIQGQRRSKGITVIPMEQSLRPVVRTLQQKELVAILFDRPVSKEDGVAITFFGRTTYVPAGVATLALLGNAAILPSFVWYGQNQNYFLRTFSPIYPRPYKGSREKNAEIARLTQETYNALEEMIRSWTTQWYMFRPFWPQDTSST